MPYAIGGLVISNVVVVILYRRWKKRYEWCSRQLSVMMASYDRLIDHIHEHEAEDMPKEYILDKMIEQLEFQAIVIEE